MFRMIIFDLDGTVLNTLDDIHSSLMDTMEKFDLEKFGIETTKTYVGDGISKLIERAVSSEKYSENIENCFREIYNKKLVETTKPYDGITDIMERFKAAGVCQVVLSNKATEYTDSIVRHFGLDKYLDGWYGFDCFHEKKPSPLPVREILKEKGFSPEETLMIGDNYTDIESGAGAGIKTCFCKYGYGKLRAVQADYFIDSPSEIPLIAGFK
ncbi:HAD family hydrolase [Geovibrio thiophilus]|uniref:phosphoglycolate phosphatase n=1 Tax=Geovibrio thiophilus TaxID=139438 RepID=A0A3R5UUY6_9BACT|nr:HAD hydrolase-like protein [Geovibrio thiophilus]QAR33287.1 HAD family hydrolase [Geovibrio thiophilus]